MSTCPTCGEHGADEAEFCEACGSRLTATPAPRPAAGTCHCGGQVSADGYCEVCGDAAPRERDHLTAAPASYLAGVTDRGRRHWRNEDALALAAPRPQTAILVVCDGVSSAPDSDRASSAAAEAIQAALARPAAPTPIASDPATSLAAWRERITVAVADGNAAVSAVDRHEGKEPPSCTVVAAVADGPLLVAGWVGDSRAYWFPDHADGVLLTTDDSVGQHMIAAGISRTQAEAEPASHAITRWLGIDSPDPIPHLVDHIATTDGWLLVCSDGLWNYCSEPGDLGVLVADSITDGQVLQAAETLVQWAIDAGGHDNITVALARVCAGTDSTTMAAVAADKDASHG